MSLHEDELKEEEQSKEGETKEVEGTRKRQKRSKALLALDDFVPRSTTGTDPAAIVGRCQSVVRALVTCVNCNARIEIKRHEEARSALADLSQQLTKIEAKQQQLFELVNFVISGGASSLASPEPEGSPP